MVAASAIGVDLDRVEGGDDGELRLDRADVVVVEDLHDLGVLDTGHALGLLAVVDEVLERSETRFG